MTSKNPKPGPKQQTQEEIRARKVSRIYLLVLLLLVAVLFLSVIRIFIVTILLAAVFTSLFYPMYEKFLRAFRGKKSLSSALCCLALLLGLLVPVYVVADLVSQEAIELYRTAEQKINEIREAGDAGLLGRIKQNSLIQRLQLQDMDWQSSINDIVKNATNLIAMVINKTSKGTFQVVTNLFITLFTMFYFFRDGDKLIARVKYLSPLDDVYEEGLIVRFASVSRATIKGTLLIGLAQGFAGGLTLWILGVSSPILWAVVMIVLSIIPMVGAWLVLYPAAIVQLIIGNTWQGITIMIVAAVIVSNIDTVLRPRLVGRDAGMHDLIIFFTTIGGISMFGIMGFIIGPVIAAFFLTLLDIYGIEFKATLDIAQTSGSYVDGSEKT